ncbi:MFS transporter [Radicibacter daui]|uniref:MFS transporter n=1 Tax=Radicibacter daui TaxID=3064829 RepID=UPI004046AFD0
MSGPSSPLSSPQKGRGRPAAALPFILVTVFLDMLVMGISAPVMPELVKQFTGGDVASAAWWVGFSFSGFSLLQFVGAPFLGALSDRFGRRPIILLSVFGLGINQLALVFAPSLFWYLAGRLVAGFCAANFATASAYMADITPPERRARNFGLIGAAFGISFIIGPAIGGPLGDYGLRLPFVVGAVLAGLNLIYGLFVLPESLPRAARQPFSWRSCNPLAAFAVLFQRRLTLGLAMGSMLGVFGMGVLQAIWVLYTGERFGWTATANGLSLAAIGLLVAIAQGALVGPSVRWLGEARTMVLGGVLTALAYFGFAFSPASLPFALSLIPFGLGGVAGPTLQSIISRSAAAGQQGAIMGALMGLQSLVFAISPFIGSPLFARYTVGAAGTLLAGVPFLFGAIATVLSLVLTLAVLRWLGHELATPRSIAADGVEGTALEVEG